MGTLHEDQCRFMISHSILSEWEIFWDTGMENQPDSANTHALIFVAEESLNNNKVNTRYSIKTTLCFLQNTAS
jgi:hypothetical protein